METKFTLAKGTILFAAAMLLFSETIFSQSWSYVGGNCCLIGNSGLMTSVGDNEIGFRSNGNAIVATYTSNSGTTNVVVKEFDGTAWTTLPNYNATGVLAAYDLEMYNDEPYLAVASAGKLRVKKYNGSAWVQLGDTIATGGANVFDFAFDNNGVPYLSQGVNPPKVYKFDGTAWTLWISIPTTSGATVFSHGVVGDNTMVFDANNLYHYVTSISEKKLIKTYDGTNFGIAGDTVAKTYAGGQIFKDKSGSLYALYNEVFKRPFIKKLVANSWTNFGDTSTIATGLTLNKADFAQDGTMYLSGSNFASEAVYKCSGAAANIVALDTLNNSASQKAQIFSAKVNPVSGKLWVSFFEIVNNANELSVMSYENNSTSVTEITNQNTVAVYPNPSNSYIHLKINYEDDLCLQLMDASGKVVMNELLASSKIDISKLHSGFYFGKLLTGNGESHSFRFMKQ